MVGKKDHYNEYTKMEIAGIESELKDWFVSRRVEMERALSIKKALDANNFSGLSMANASVPPMHKVIWGDLVSGKPELEDSLSENARVMKADMYLKTFRNATDLDNICRVPGSVYLRCLRDNAKASPTDRSTSCSTSFAAFNVCRNGLKASQEEALEKSLMRQDIADHRAKSLFERRSILLDTISV